MAATRMQPIEGGVMRELDVANESRYVKSERLVRSILIDEALSTWSKSLVSVVGDGVQG
jgi:hypothetical protein